MEKQIFESPEDAARGFAGYLLAKHKQSERLTIALSGGSTPKILFDLLASEFQDEFDWSKIHLFWGDERCVPPTDSDSNYRMTVEHLLSKIEIPAENIHRVLGENEPQSEAERYSAELMSSLTIANGLPQFDVITLGMGGDGHTASIFPHEMELRTDNRICAIGINPDSGQQRVTLTGPVINNAKAVCFLVTGSGKAEKVDEIFNQDGNYQDYPATHVRPTHGDLKWFLDKSSAVNLKQ